MKEYKMNFATKTLTITKAFAEAALDAEYSTGECVPGAKSNRSRFSTRFLTCSAVRGLAMATTAPSFLMSSEESASTACARALRSAMLSCSISSNTSTSFGS